MKTVPYSELTVGYAILITRKDGSCFFASAKGSARFFTTRFAEAQEFRRLLRENRLKGKVVKATFELSVIAKKERNR